MAISSERRAIGKRIKEAITRRGISQNELARRFGKGSSAGNGWTTGRTQPSLEDLAEISKMTGVSADWIIGAPHAPAPPPPAVDVRAVRRLVKKGREFVEVVEALAKGLPDDEP